MSSNPRVKAMMRSRIQEGFSLVEVVIAVGVMAFSSVAIFALLPMGLGVFHEAMDASVSADIAQRVVSDAAQSDFNALTSNTASGNYFALPLRYFDDQGNEIKVRNPAAPSSTELAKVLYWVRVRGSLPGSPNPATHSTSCFTSLPSTGGQRFNPRASSFLTVQIVSNPRGLDLGKFINTDYLIDGPKAQAAHLPVQSCSAVISRNGN